MPSMYELAEVDGKKQYLINKQPLDENKVPTNTKNVLTLENVVDEFGTIIVDNKKSEDKEEDTNTTSPASPAAPDPGEMATSPPPPNDAGEEKATDQEDTTDTDDSTPSTEEVAAAKKAAADKVDNEQKTANTKSEDKDPLPGDKGADEEPLLDDSEDSDLQDDLDDGADDILAEDEDLDEDPEDDNRDKAAPKADVQDDPPAENKADEQKAVPSRGSRNAVRTLTSAKFKSKVPQSSPGMGFPRKDGKTSDIFDINVPHTQVKLVGGHAVPLSAQSYQTRSEGEIMARLIELGFEITDYNEIERKQNHSDAVGGNGLLMEDEEVDEDIRLG